MPKYFLGESDMAVMVHYLKHLSTGLQPGVTETTLRFATVVTEDVPPEDREAMLRLLELYLKNWRISRNQERMARTEAFIREGATRDVRKFSLARWELKGPEETWREQLEAYYRKDPVFALLGGITSGDWAPIHGFCEAHRIPAIFPVTDFPVATEKNSSVYLTYPYTLPQDSGRYRDAVEKTLRSGNRPGPGLFMSYKLQVLRLALNGPLSMMRTYVYRDYFLELLDETADLSMIPVPYPQLSFGRGQRYASKGCYIIQLGKGPESEMIRRSEWVVTD